MSERWLKIFPRKTDDELAKRLETSPAVPFNLQGQVIRASVIMNFLFCSLIVFLVLAVVEANEKIDRETVVIALKEGEKSKAYLLPQLHENFDLEKAVAEAVTRDLIKQLLEIIPDQLAMKHRWAEDGYMAAHLSPQLFNPMVKDTQKLMELSQAQGMQMRYLPDAIEHLPGGERLIQITGKVLKSDNKGQTRSAVSKTYTIEYRFIEEMPKQLRQFNSTGFQIIKMDSRRTQQ